MHTALFAAALALSLSSVASAEAPAPNPWWDGYFANGTRVALPDGRRINLYCQGKGAPTVVLDAGLGDGAWSWRKVQGRIAATTRVCVYDRAGYGGSDPGPGPRDLRALTRDLEAVLTAGRVPGPYVLVGHSAAGLTTRLYAYRHPERVAGLVLVDPSTEGQAPRLAAAAPGMAKAQALMVGAGKACAQASRPPSVEPLCVRAPGDLPKAMTARWARMQGPDHYRAAGAELDGMMGPNTAQLEAEWRPFGVYPVWMLTRGEPATPGGDKAEQVAADTVWREMHAETMTLAPRGIHRVIAGAGHYIQQDKPDAVVEAITEVVAEVRAAKR